MLLKEYEAEERADQVLNLFIALATQDSAIPDGLVNAALNALDALGSFAPDFLQRHLAPLTTRQQRQILRLLRAGL